jgi:hypothetical protein
VVGRTQIDPTAPVTTSNLTCLHLDVYDEDPEDGNFTFSNSWLVNGAELNVTEDELQSEYFVKGPYKTTLFELLAFFCFKRA